MKMRSHLLRGASLLLALLLTFSLWSAGAAPEEAGSEAPEIIRADVSDRLFQLGGSPPAAPEDRAVLLEDWDEAKEAIAEGLRNRAEAIPVGAYGISYSQAGDVYFAALNENPELFYVKGSFGISMTSTGTVTDFYPDYDSRYTPQDTAAFLQAAEEILAQVDPQWEDALKLLFLHDYIVTHCQYDLSYSRYNAFNVLVEHSAVCEGYTLAFLYLARRVGIEAWMVSSDALGHAWNLVRLDGRYYYVDCTHDDPLTAVSIDGETYPAHCYEAYCAHTHFLRSYASTRENGHNADDWSISGWSGAFPPTAGDEQFENAFWRDVETPVAFRAGSMVYFHRADRDRLWIWDMDRREETAYPLKNTLTWYAWDGGGSWWTENYGTFAVLEGEVYFTTPTEIVHLLPEGQMETVYALSAEEAAQGYLYGMVAEDGALCYSIGEDYCGEDFLRRSFAPSPAVPVLGITLNKDSLALTAGGQETLTARAETAGGESVAVSWESLNPAVASVGPDGTVTGISGGSTSIIARAGGKSAACAVTVTVPVSGITLNKSELSLVKGDSQRLLASVLPTEATDPTVRWQSSDPAVALVDERGLVTARAGGSAVITAAAGNRSAECAVTVTVPVAGIELTETSLTLYPGESAALSPRISPSDATDRTILWTSSVPGVAEVDENGAVTALAPGSTEIMARAGGFTAHCTVTVEAVPEETVIASAEIAEDSVCSGGYCRETDALLLLAVYDEDGRMTACRVLPLPEGGSWQVSESFSSPFVRAKVFVLDRERVPLCASLEG